MNFKSEQLNDYFVDDYLPTIGVECHVQLDTKTKLFTAINNQLTDDQLPNSAVGPLCLGLPGTLPVVNQKALDLAIAAGLFLKAKIASETRFDRKHYFYPDLPSGYQISQHHYPIIEGGLVEIPTDAKTSFSVRIQKAHLEADAGKLTHVEGQDYSLVDLNRVGTPLLEIVSQPDLHSPQQVKQYAKELYLLMTYARVCQGNLAAGNLRFDVNVSVSKSANQLGIRTEIKNLNSFRFIEQAVRFEINRQIQLLEDNQTVIQETRGFDEQTKTTFSQRQKEDAQDYRYMPDPDIPPIKIDSNQVQEVEKNLPIKPQIVRQTLNNWRIPFSDWETILDNQKLAQFLVAKNQTLNIDQAQLFVKWLIGDLLALLKQNQIVVKDILNNFENLKIIINKRLADEISNLTVKQVLVDLLVEKISLTNILNQSVKTQITDQTQLQSWIDQIIQEYPQAFADAKQDAKASGFLVGQVMKLSQNQANPRKVAELIQVLLKNK